ncbi:hypothetical protein ABFT23_00385 [Nocardioides sp. C4-1]|uniref:hypothetical protein n=1 Tax=Nocardioides sp. C4-1 TaxID=3151851 RepID=UPI00326709CA
MSEQDTSRLLHEATRTLPDHDTDVETLVRGGIARGRARRRRRRAGTTVAAAAVVAAVAVAGVTTGATGPQGVRDDADVGDRPTSAVGVEPGRLAVPAAEVPATFAALLPDVEVGPVQRGPDHPFVDDFRHTAVDFLVDGDLTRFEVEPLATAPTCPELARSTPGAACATRGGIEVLRAGPTGADGVRTASAWFMGYRLSATSWGPALDVEQLESVVVSDRWYLGPDDVAAGADESGSAAVRARWTDLAPTDLAGLLVDRLPDDGSVSRPRDYRADPPPFADHSPGFSMGTSLLYRGALVDLQVSGEVWEELGTFDDYAGCEQLECEERPDGSVVTVSVRDDLDGDGGLSQWVMLTRPDGGRVSVMASNTPDDTSAPVDDEPVLTVDQLREIVLDPVWLSGS